MGVLLQGFYKILPNNAVPSPADGEGTELFWWDQLATEANSFRQAGFTAIWLPPVLKTASGNSKGADGYGPYDDYDIGSRHQKGSTSTRFGTREQLQRCVAVLRANGLDVYLDMVEHHRSGDSTPFVFRYPGADGTGEIGRFPKSPSNFIPQVPRDPNLGGPPQDDAPFGREMAPINAKPAQYVFNNLIDASDWLTRALDVQGYRLDDVKGLSTDFLRPFLDSKSMNGKFAVGEFFDGNRDLVNGWIFNPTGMQGRSSAFDFPTKFILNAVCNNAGRFNMATLDHAGLAGISPMSAVTFVENHDTDLNRTANIVSNKILGYAYILTSEGYPCVYYRDYSTGPNGYGMKPEIDNLIWIHEKLANGPTLQRFLDFNLIAYERVGGPRLLVALNNDPGNQRTVTVATGFGSNVPLHDYTGHSGDVTTDGNGNVTITVPPNNNGLGYVCYSRDGQVGGFDITTLPVTQEFEGAADLDILPALGGTPVQPCRVWCAENSPIRAVFVPDITGWTDATAINVDLLAPDNKTVLAQLVVKNNNVGTTITTAARVEGFHTFRLTAANTPAANLNPSYKLSVTYTAPTTFTPAGAAVPAAPAAGSAPAQVGQWSEVFPLANVPIHAHLLPTGKVLFWGRRVPVGDTPAGSPDPRPDTFDSLNQHATSAFLWDPANPGDPGKPTSNSPVNGKGESINLFCSGHTFLPDGTLLVTGGHLFDSQGISSSTFYNPFKDTWSVGPDMGVGSERWYPTAVTLADGRALVFAGSHANADTIPAAPPNAPQTSVVAVSQVLDNGKWVGITDFLGLPLYPRVHVAPNGFVFMSGPLANTYYIKNFLPPNGDAWLQIALRGDGGRDYAPSVMYDVGKVIFIGGGLDMVGNTSGTPGNQAEIIDLNAAQPQWTNTAPMHFARRQHNATILPDGTVLVTGGTQGAGNGSTISGFNDLRLGQPVHTAELWNPATGQWTRMSDEAVDRCYHSTAVLLPDGRVFSGGGGEYAPENQIESNAPKDSHPDCQLFSPPYLCKGLPRPVISQAPPLVEYGQEFEVQTPDPTQISQITWIRLASVTHSFDQNQRINFLAFQPGEQNVTVTAPANANVCPPGHYMLFLLNQQKVPSVASIIQILPTAAPQAATAPSLSAVVPLQARPPAVAVALKPLAEKMLSPEEVDAAIQRSEHKPPVVVGVTPICPYGLAACWGGAYEGLKNMTGVRLVRPMPNSKDSTAFVYLDKDGLPDIAVWPADFAKIANAAHRIRGVEVEIEDLVKDEGNETLVLQGSGDRPTVLLQPIQPSDKIQWDATKAAPQPLSPDEEQAYAALAEQAKNSKDPLRATVIGPLQISGKGFILKVREFSISKDALKA